MQENSDVVEVTLRDKKYEIQPLSLDAVEKIWPLLEKAKKNRDEGIEMSVPDMTSYACSVLSLAILDSYPDSGLDADTVKKTVTFRQVEMIQSKIAEILRKAGLSTGEQAPAEGVTASPSTETSEASTPSS